MKNKQIHIFPRAQQFARHLVFLKQTIQIFKLFQSVDWLAKSKKISTRRLSINNSKINSLHLFRKKKAFVSAHVLALALGYMIRGQP